LSHAAPCKVGIKRGRIFYNARKLWIADLKPNRVLHGEHVAFYCLNREARCGYAVASTCNNGNIPIPECFVGEFLTAQSNSKCSSSVHLKAGQILTNTNAFRFLNEGTMNRCKSLKSNLFLMLSLIFGHRKSDCSLHVFGKACCVSMQQCIL